MFRIQEELIQYVDFEEGKIVANNLPEELEDAFEKLKKQYESMKNEDLKEY